jgi:REP element-mobilizing transposase RayT
MALKQPSQDGSPLNPPITAVTKTTNPPLGHSSLSPAFDADEGSPRNVHLFFPMKKPKQLNLFKPDLRMFGGQLLHGKRRGRRPLSTKEPIHLVLRSSWCGGSGAMGSNSFLAKRNKHPIYGLIQRTAKDYGIRIYQVALMSNHLHLVIRIFDRKAYRRFVRVLASRIASHVMRDQSFRVFKRQLLNSVTSDPSKELPGQVETQGKGQAFWQFRPWSRVLYWGRDCKNCCDYVKQNVLEALGFVQYKPRKHRYMSSDSEERKASSSNQRTTARKTGVAPPI